MTGATILAGVLSLLMLSTGAPSRMAYGPAAVAQADSPRQTTECVSLQAQARRLTALARLVGYRGIELLKAGEMQEARAEGKRQYALMHKAAKVRLAHEAQCSA